MILDAVDSNLIEIRYIHELISSVLESSFSLFEYLGIWSFFKAVYQII